MIFETLSPSDGVQFDMPPSSSDTKLTDHVSDCIFRTINLRNNPPRIRQEFFMVAQEEWINLSQNQFK